MAAHGRRTLRNLFDDSPTPHIAHPPETHHRDFYVATDGSYRHDGDGGLGVIVETRGGERVTRVAVPDSAPNNNIAEYRALQLGLDVLSERSPSDARIGILVDHDELARNVNAQVLAFRDPRKPMHQVTLPPGVEHHWDDVEERLAGFPAVRAALIDGDDNPAHPLANDPAAYEHVNDGPARCVLPEEEPATEVPPPSRSSRNASD